MKHGPVASKGSLRLKIRLLGSVISSVASWNENLIHSFVSCGWERCRVGIPESARV